MATLTTPAQGAIVLTAFALPILTYLYFTRAQQHATSSTSSDAGPLPPPTEITALYIHPIKSCHGISVDSARLLPTGLDLDRQWMWVSHPSHEFLTIRNASKMTLIRPSYDAASDTLTITAPGPDSESESELKLSIPAHPDAAYLAANTSIHDVKIWNQWTPAHIYSPDLTAPFTAFFGFDVRLAYKPPFSPSPSTTSTMPPRPLRSNGAADVLGREAATCFPDLMPVLLASAASLAELNTRLAAQGHEAITERRFRPNVLVRGDAATPWDEDRWKTVVLCASEGGEGGEKGAITLDITQRCARCRVPNVDPDTGDQHRTQPWDTLMKYRRVDEGIKFKPCYGMLCVPRGIEGREEGVEVKVGMKVRVTEVTGAHRYIAGF